MAPQIIRIARTTSTQDEARSLWSSGDARLGDVVVAEEQTAGRGRFGRAWISPVGGLYSTFLVAPDALLPLRAGLAVSVALEALGIDAQLKWPNDVLVDGQKLAGLLIEQVDEVALVGLGVNVAQAPIETATCIHQLRSDLSPCDLIQPIRGQMDRWLTAPRAEAVHAYRTKSETLGSRVRIDRGEAPMLEGIARDIDGSGCLLVDTAAGEITVCSGDCLHLRSA